MVRIIRHNDLLGPEQGGDKAGETRSGTKLKDGFTLDEALGVVLEILSDDLCGIP